MQKIRKVLDLPIQKGVINWVKLEEKIHAALALVKNDFNSFKPDGEKQSIKLRDELDFDVTTSKGIFIYKLIKPRFVNTNLYCSGFQLGSYDIKGNPFFHPNTLAIF